MVVVVLRVKAVVVVELVVLDRCNSTSKEGKERKRNKKRSVVTGTTSSISFHPRRALKNAFEVTTTVVAGE